MPAGYYGTCRVGAFRGGTTAATLLATNASGCQCRVGASGGTGIVKSVSYWDPDTRVLYHHPSNDDPGATHFVRILPPIDQRPAMGWQYYVKGNQIIAHE